MTSLDSSLSYFWGVETLFDHFDEGATARRSMAMVKYCYVAAFASKKSPTTFSSHSR